MFSALLYLQFQTLKNRLVTRVRRLKSPRYFFGAVAGGAYLILVFARPLLLMHHGVGGSTARVQFQAFPTIPGMTAEVWEFLAALALFILLAASWLIPSARAALVFTEAEIAFLFPAPIRRRTLIHYKLLRSQTAIFFTAIFLTFITRWSGGLGGALMRAAGWWVLISTINLHVIGASFMRTILLEHGLTPWRRRALIVAILAAIVGAAAWWGGEHIPQLTDRDTISPAAFVHYVQSVASSSPAIWLLWPFRLVVRPFLASGDAHVFVRAIGPALLLLAAHYLWVTRCDVAFEEASIAASQKYATRVAAMRSGNWQNARPARKRRAPFKLAPHGSPAVAIFWKNLIGAGQFFNARIGLAIVIWAAIGGSAFGASSHSSTPWVPIVGYMCVTLVGISLVLGPQLIRQDFRRDLAAADLLKIYPMRGWQVALGELLAPVAILTVFQWVLITIAVTLIARAGQELHGRHGFFTSAWRAPLLLGGSAAVLVPGFNAIALLIPNAAALLLPAWFAGNNTNTLSGGGRGIEVMGQRLLFLLAQIVVLTVALVPAAVVAFIVYNLGARPFLGAQVSITIASCAAAVIFAGEALCGIAVLGGWFEKYDLSAEKPA